MESPNLTTLSTCFIVPSTPTHTHFMYLSPLDTFWTHIHYNRRILFYHISLSDYPSYVDRLKQSLSEVLVCFYPWAGRLAESSEDGASRIAVHCNDAGVEFVEASIDLRFCNIEEEGFQMHPFFNALAQLDHHSPHQIFHLPLLSIQVTKFLEGGMALGVAHSHVIADGHSLWHFLNSWAECGRGINPISRPPLHDRTLLKVDNPSPEIAWRWSSVIKCNEDPEDEKEAEAEKEETNGEPKDMAQRLFHFSKDMINKLKERSSFEEGGRTMRYSSYEVLCAHFWRHVTRARKLDEQTRVFIPVLVNFRSRLAKPLPPSYFGNVLLFAITATKAGDLLREDFAATSQRIHEAVVACTEDKLWELIHYLELDQKSAVVDVRRAFRGEGIKIASSPWFPVYEVDFGWGRPKAVRAAKVKGNGEMVMFPGREEKGSVDICMSLTQKSMESLENDCEFIFNV